ncbi:MAG: hypothetical protein CM15mV4_0380 [Caudoviricetes sp.]|nr:MAG: hypothetical protein CM15mV4_0380 [Caudoviricetes sp.]
MTLLLKNPTPSTVILSLNVTGVSKDVTSVEITQYHLQTLQELLSRGTLPHQ